MSTACIEAACNSDERRVRHLFHCQLCSQRHKYILPDGAGGVEPVTVKKSATKPDVYDCEYYPLKAGNHTVTVNYGGKPIPRSPFLVWKTVDFEKLKSVLGKV